MSAQAEAPEAEEVEDAPKPSPCSRGRHWYHRDRTAPSDRQWTCRYCPAVAPMQPGVGTPGTSLGWPA